MREDDLIRVLLVQACEQSDPDGLYIAFGDRKAASRAASRPVDKAVPASVSYEHTREPESSDAEGWILRRAEPLAARLVETHRAFRRACSVAPLALPNGLVIGVAVLLGIGLDTLGSPRRINLLSFPLLGLLLWNLGVYAALVLRRFSPTRFRAPLALARIAERLSGFATHESGSPIGPGAAAGAWQAVSLQRFFSQWRETCGDLLEARVARMFHSAAAGLALGAILSMYFTGFALEYRATWESTFLDASEVHSFLALLLNPASAILGIALPSAAEVAALESPGDGEAALWIHLWSVLTALVILLPRSILAVAGAVRERRARGSLAFDLESPYALGLLAPDRGEGSGVEVLPYSYRPSPRSVEQLRELLLEVFGNRARLDFCEPLAYGERLPASVLATGGDRCRVLVFNLAQSPEQEVHAALLEELKHWVADGDGRERILVLLDEEPHARRLGSSEAEQRLAQRRRAWERVIRSCDLGAGVLSEGALVDATLREALAQIWPRVGAEPSGAPTSLQGEGRQA